MITEHHSDGGCFKLCIEYTDFDSLSHKHIRYSEDFDELLQYGINNRKEVENDGWYVIDFRIQDDSK